MIPRILKVWFLTSFIITALSGIIYLAVQQSYRQNANDPQIQMAEDVASMLSQGSDLRNFSLDGSDYRSIFGVYYPESFDTSNSLAPFLIVYDSQGFSLGIMEPVNLKYVNLNLTSGDIDYIKLHGQLKRTWEPQKGMRYAAVIVPYATGQYITKKSSGYILVARSLREVEKRESMLGVQVGAGWAVTTIGSLILIGFLEVITSKKNGK